MNPNQLPFMDSKSDERVNNKSNPKLYVGKSFLNNYFKKSRVISDPKATNELRRSPRDFMLSGPSCFCSDTESKRNIAINTDFVELPMFKASKPTESYGSQVEETKGCLNPTIYKITEENIQNNDSCAGNDKLCRKRKVLYK